MKETSSITALFLDIVDILLTDGWDHHARKRAATTFKLELTEMEDRHHLTSDTYEEGKLTLEEYLGRVVFYEERPFTPAQFRKVMFAQVAEGLGIRGICHTDYRSTCAKLASFDLQNDEGVIHASPRSTIGSSR